METVQELVLGLAFRRDPRVLGGLSLGLPAVALIGYSVLVAFGPRLMKGRATPQLGSAMTVYNIGQVRLLHMQTGAVGLLARSGSVNYLGHR